MTNEFTQRENDVLKLLRDGLRPNSISKVLGIKKQTVSSHISAIQIKTNTEGLNYYAVVNAANKLIGYKKGCGCFKKK